MKLHKWLKKFNILTDSLLSAASILVAGLRKAPNPPIIESWHEKARYMFLMSKLSAINKYRMGYCNAISQFHKQ